MSVVLLFVSQSYFRLFLEITKMTNWVWYESELPDGVRETNTGRLENEESGRIVYLCDGAYRNVDGRRYAGYGIFGGPNFYEYQVDDSNWPTNNTAELKGVLNALEHAFDNQELTFVEVLTDSEYATKSLNNYIYKWRTNNWKTVHDYPVANQALIEKCMEYVDNYNVEVRWIPRQQNRIADKLAKLARDGETGYLSNW